jgi:hypothetical protein
MVYLDRGDGSGESLAGLLRPGNAGSNTTDDHIDAFEMALGALPALPGKVKLVVRADTAGCTYAFWTICVRPEWGSRSASRSTPRSGRRSAR